MTPQEYEMLLSNGTLQQQMNMNSNAYSQQLLIQEQEKGLAEEQLDVEEIIDRIHNLLLGKEYKEENGKKVWVDGNSNMRILSDWGVRRVMQIVRFFINKNTLLSNFSQEEINRQMFHFTTELNDLVLLKYQKLFREISFAECKEILEKKLFEKASQRAFTIELLGETPNKIQIMQELKDELETRIEKEVEKVRENELKERIKEYGLLLWEIESAVYATYNRALGGKERETLRRHAQFSEIRALAPEGQKNKGGLFGWLKGN